MLKRAMKWILVFVLLSLLSISATAQTNLLNDGGMESWSSPDALSHWGKESGFTLTCESSQKHSGSNCARMQRTGISNKGIYQEVNVTAGNTYTFKAWAYRDGSNSNVGLVVSWYADDTYLSYAGPAKSSGVGSWEEVSLANREAPAGATKAVCRIRAYTEGDDSDESLVDDAFFYDDASLPVTMGTMAASVEDEGIRIHWSTESETETVGFHVLRAGDQEGPYLRVTSDLIPAKGSGSSGCSYTYLDRGIQPEQVYWYKIEELSLTGLAQVYGPIRAAFSFSGHVPNACRLLEPFPNPFNPATTIRYQVDASAPVQRTEIVVFDLLGREITTLVNRSHTPGNYTVVWDGRDHYGKNTASGVYVCRLAVAGHFIDSNRLLKME